MRVLFLHDNFPAQFGGIGQYLARAGWTIFFGTQKKGVRLSGIEVVNYKPHRKVSQSSHPYTKPLEKAVLTGQAAARMGFDLRKRGFQPDVVVAHSGWGPGLFVKDVWPDTKLIGYYEWYYEPIGPDVMFLDGKAPPADRQLLGRSRNAPILMDLAHGDWGITPTEYQRDRFPRLFRDRLTVQHDGVDADFFAPINNPRFQLPDLELPDDAEIVTYVARGMEPYRGFPQFMAALAEVQKRRPRVHAVIAGTDRVAYGRKLPDGKSYREQALEGNDLQQERTHFVGLLPRNQYRLLLQASSVHVYLTIPFVLSWSMLEAMSTGCLLVASNTEPVREMVEDSRNGLLVDFFDVDGIAERICDAIESAENFKPIRAAARQTILDRYSVNVLYPQKKSLLEKIVEGSLTA